MRDLTLDVVADAIGWIDASDRDLWIKVGMSLKSEFGDEAFSVWDKWASAASSYNERASRTAWKSFKQSGATTIGTFVHLATASGYKFANESMTDAEREQQKQDRLRRQDELKRRRIEDEKNAREQARAAALRAENIWGALSLSGQSVYLQNKKVDGFGLKYSPKGSAVLLVQDVKGKIHGLQFLRPDGSKRFWPKGIKKAGHFHRIGDEPFADASGRVRFAVCEGYATGASIHAATGLTVFVAFDAGNLHLAAKALRAKWRDAEIIIAADDDYQTKISTGKNPGLEHAETAARLVKGRVALPQFKNRNGEKWTDFNDLHNVEGLDAVAACFAVRDSKWLRRLARNNQGVFKPDIHNVLQILINDDRWRGVLRYDRFTYDILKIKPPPFEHNARAGEWTESDTTWLQGWFLDFYDFTPKENDTIRAVMAVAELMGFHPVLDYLHGLTWDGEPRLDRWLADYLGAVQAPYTACVGRKFMIGAVARVHAELLRPVKMDNVLILEGEQGAGKSSVIEVLGGAWSAETHFDLGSKDGYLQMRGVWLYELSELDAFNKAETTRAKMFFSAREDNYRPPYAKRTQKFPRQTVFVGTTNQDHYLKDVTGNRRYWPIRCRDIDLDALRSARDQLWAEALVRYRQKEPWWASPNEREIFHEQQEERFQDDAWEMIISTWLSAPDARSINQFTTHSIMEGALCMEPHQIKPPEQTRVGLIMKRLGWRKHRPVIDGKRNWVYERPQDERIATLHDDSPI